MTPLEVDPVRLLAAVALALLLVGLVSYRLGWMERRRVEAERRDEAGRRAAQDWRARYRREDV